MTKASIGFSTKADLDRAVTEVLTDAPERPILALVYAGIAHDQEALSRALRAALPGVPLVGASTQGVTTLGRSYEADRFIAVALFASETVGVRRAGVADITIAPRDAGRALAAGMGPPPTGPSTTLLFYDPLGGADVTELLGGLAEGGYPLIYGGASGQPWATMVRTYQYCDEDVYTKGAVAVTLDGLEPVAELTHGAEAIGLELRATRTAGNVVLELDERPALDVWCEQLGIDPARDVENTANWALGVVPDGPAPYEGVVTRAPFGFDQASRALIFQAPIASGSSVQVCVRTHPAVLNGAAAMAERLAAALVGRRPVLALSFECGARPAPFLGADLAETEIIGIQDRLPSDLPWLGMYAWGEIAPVGGKSDFHNYTFPLCVLCEPRAAV